MQQHNSAVLTLSIVVWPNIARATQSISTLPVLAADRLFDETVTVIQHKSSSSVLSISELKHSAREAKTQTLVCAYDECNRDDQHPFGRGNPSLPAQAVEPVTKKEETDPPAAA